MCMLIPIVSLGGALPAVLGIVGLMLCVKISKTNLSTFVRILICTGITLMAWFLWVLLVISMS